MHQCKKSAVRNTAPTYKVGAVPCSPRQPQPGQPASCANTIYDIDIVNIPSGKECEHAPQQIAPHHVHEARAQLGVVHHDLSVAQLTPCGVPTDFDTREGQGDECRSGYKRCEKVLEPNKNHTPINTLRMRAWLRS